MKKYILSVLAVIFVFALMLAGCSVDKDDSVEPETTTLQIDENFYSVEVPFSDTVSSFTFDENDRLLSCSNPGTNTDTELINYTYDSNGNCICITRFNSDKNIIAEKRFQFDANGRCSKEETYELDGETKQLVFNFSLSYERNSDGKITRITDENGLTESYEYDENGLCISETTVHADGTLIAESEFIYDENGRLIKVDSDKANREYEYDAQGRIFREKDGFFVVEYEYCDDGSVLMYNLEEGEEKGNPSVRKEYFGDGKIIKNTWYEGTEETEINIFLAEEVLENEPDPTVTIRYR